MSDLNLLDSTVELIEIRNALNVIEVELRIFENSFFVETEKLLHTAYEDCGSVSGCHYGGGG